MIPKNIKWDITTNCNLRCSHCSVGKNYFNGDVKELSLQQKLEIIDKLVEGGVEGISLLGGEPLTMGDDFFTFINYAVSKGLDISLVSNGLLLSGEVLQKVLDSGISRVVVSLEGATIETHEMVRGKNTFNKLLGNIKDLTEKAKDKNIHVNINTVLNRKNYHELEALIDLCLKLGVDEWTLLSMVDIGFAEDNKDKLALSAIQEINAAKIIAQRYASNKNMDKLSISPLFVYPLIWDYIEDKYGLKMQKSQICCSATISLGFIGPDGNLYPCDRVPGENYVGYEIGNDTIKPKSLVTQSFYDIWNSDYFVNMFELILNDKTYEEYTPCNNCKYLKSRYCNPCPLYSLDSKVVIKTCLIAKKHLGDISGSDEDYSFVNDMMTSNIFDQKDDELQKGYTFNQITNITPKKELGVRSCEKDELLILLNPYKVEFIGLNLMGKVIWDLIDGEKTVKEISTQINTLVNDAKNEAFPHYKDGDLQSQLNKNTTIFFNALSRMGFIQPLNGMN